MIIMCSAGADALNPRVLFWPNPSASKVAEDAVADQSENGSRQAI
jgi:hypothetical protein